MSRQADRQHRRAQQELADRTAAVLRRLLAAFPEAGEQAAMDAYNRASMRTVGGGQRRAAQLALAYLAGIRPPTRPPSMSRALEPVLVKPDSPVTRSPVLRLWRLLGEGSELAAAKAAAGDYAALLGSTELAVAERAGLAEGGRASGASITGWRKELGPNACDWCVLTSDDVYRSPDSVPFHSNDTCSVSPVFADEEV